MRNRAFSKKLMLVVGILAAVIIICSQAFQKETTSFLTSIVRPESTTTKHSAGKAAGAERNAVITTTSDAVITGQAVEVWETDPSLIREIIFGESTSPQKIWVDKKTISNLFKTLFRVFISPQAP